MREKMLKHFTYKAESVMADCPTECLVFVASYLHRKTDDPFRQIFDKYAFMNALDDSDLEKWMVVEMFVNSEIDFSDPPEYYWIDMGNRLIGGYRNDCDDEVRIDAMLDIMRLVRSVPVSCIEYVLNTLEIPYKD